MSIKQRVGKLEARRRPADESTKFCIRIGERCFDCAKVPEGEQAACWARKWADKDGAHIKIGDPDDDEH